MNLKSRAYLYNISSCVTNSMSARRAFQFRLIKCFLSLLAIYSSASVYSLVQDDPINSRANQAQELIRDWSLRFGRDIHFGTQEVTCLRSIRDQFDPSKSDTSKRGDYRSSIVSNDWNHMHSEIVKTISKTMSWHRNAVESIARASEQLAGNHIFEKNFTYDYVDVHRLYNIDDEELSYNNPEPDMNPNYNDSDLTSPINPSSDSTMDTNTVSNQEMGQFDANGQLVTSDTEQAPSEPLPKPSSLQSAGSSSGEPSSGEWQTPIKYLKLSKHRNFGDILINNEESAVHTPVHIYPGDPQVMNDIAWSDKLTKVFRDNFVRNPKLTNQYFASQSGFLRLFPAQKWQIPRNDPDLYDARMRPWYVAGVSSRKDVIILVDSSGSMTGSRRDIAKGVVSEILDTLTENDHFLILKFSDSIQQVGVPSCPKMRVERKSSSIPLRNTMFHRSTNIHRNENDTDIDSLYLMPATGKNIRLVKANFTIATSGIANFSKALVTAFEVLRNYQDSDQLGSKCNQAIMLITDGSPSDFEEIFNRYNYPNAPVRVFTYLIGREAGDVTHTKMMACHNRGYYTHVINLAEVRETVQQYISVMARPLVLNGTHPVTWTSAYGELTYQILTDWIWESKRREKVRALLAANSRVSSSNGPDISVTSDEGPLYDNGEENYEALERTLEAVDLFGYEGNTDCFWETKSNDLLSTVVQPVYDQKNESVVTEKFLVKNVWTMKETVMRTAKVLGVAAADMKINDLIALAPSHKLGANGYAVMLTNNGYVMHHPDLRSILEPFSNDPSEKNMRILKPFFSSMDFTLLEHILNSTADDNLLALRKDSVSGLTGWRELFTKRTVDCQKRVQSRLQKFYFKPIDKVPFSFMIAIPQPYGSHRVEAQIEIKSASLPEKLRTYFTNSDYDLWTVHKDYQYCDGPSNKTITTLLDMFLRIEERKLDDIQWRPAESSQPQQYLPSKIVCDKDLVQSLVYDAVATFGFSESCSLPNLNNEHNLLGMFGVRFSFVATRSGLTRIRRYDADDEMVKIEALAFSKKHSRAVDETFYSRTVDYNMLINDSATLIQVPFNTHERIRNLLNDYEAFEFASQYNNPGLNLDNGNDSVNMDSLLNGGANRISIKNMSLIERLERLTNKSLHTIATQSIIINEGTQRAVVGVTGIFYDYATFVLRFFNTTNTEFQDKGSITKPATCFTDNSKNEFCDESKAIKCGLSNDTIDCLMLDNNGFIVVSEDLDYIGRHLKDYDRSLLNHLVNFGVYHEVNITDYQAICLRLDEKQSTSSAYSSSIFQPNKLVAFISSLMSNVIAILAYTWTILSTLFTSNSAFAQPALLNKQSTLLTNKTYLRPCEKTLTLYETRLNGKSSSSAPLDFITQCGCEAWVVFEQVPKTNLIMLIVNIKSDCTKNCDQISQPVVPIETIDAKPLSLANEEKVCSMLERELQLYRQKLESCFSHHEDEENIKICGSANKLCSLSYFLLIIMCFIELFIYFQCHET